MRSPLFLKVYVVEMNGWLLWAEAVSLQSSSRPALAMVLQYGFVL